MALKRTKTQFDSVSVYVNISSLTPAPWNPPNRIRADQLKDLRVSMERDGWWDYAPGLVTADDSDLPNGMHLPSGTIIDCHRRFTVARMIGLVEAPVTLVEGRADQLWMEYNTTRAPVTGAQVLQAHMGGAEYLPPAAANGIRLLREIIGEDGLSKLSALGFSAAIYSKMRRVAKYVGREDDFDWQKKCIHWMVDSRHMQTIAVRACQTGADVNEIIAAVESGKPLQYVWGHG